MEIYKKLANVKKQVGAIAKTETNAFMKNTYFNINGLLGQVEPLLQEEGLLLLQPIEDGKVISRIIDVDTGEKVESSIDLGEYPDPQKMGSYI